MNAHAQFTASAQDAVSAVNLMRREGHDYWKLYISGGALFCLIMVIYAWIVREIPPVIFGIGVGILFPCTLVLPQWVLPHWVLRTAAKKAAGADFEISIQESGIEMKSSAAQVRYSWEVVQRALLDEQGILLYFDRDDPFFIPARGFSGGYPRTELTELLRRKLKNA